MSRAPNITRVPLSRAPSDNVHEKDTHFSRPIPIALGEQSGEHSDRAHVALRAPKQKV